MSLIQIYRDSFEYAKYLVGQLRSIKQEISLPIIIVANKIDLERAKVVKSEGKYNLSSVFSHQLLTSWLTN